MDHRLPELLKERGAKYRLAKKLGRNAGFVSQLCSGRVGLNSRSIKAISDALGIPPWQLFIDPKEAVSPEFKALIEGYLSLDPARKALVDDMMVAAGLRNAADKKPKK